MSTMQWVTDVPFEAYSDYPVKLIVGIRFSYQSVNINLFIIEIMRVLLAMSILKILMKFQG